MEIRRLATGDEVALMRFVSRIPEGDRTFFKEDVLDAEVVAAWVQRGEARSLAVEDEEILGTGGAGSAGRSRATRCWRRSTSAWRRWWSR